MMLQPAVCRQVVIICYLCDAVTLFAVILQAEAIWFRSQSTKEWLLIV